MLTQKQIIQIRALLEKAKTPFYFFDGDPDGLCSFLLLMKKYEKGDFECANFPVDDERPYLEKSKEIYSDLIVILDRAYMTQKAINSFRTKVLWIDHHPPLKRNNVFYFNSRLNRKEVPTTYMAYQITRENEWLATVGTIADYHLPAFSNNFSRQYPEILPKKIINLDEILFDTKMGQLIDVFNFNLHGAENSIRKNVNYLLKIKDPLEILEQKNKAGKLLYKNYQKLNKKYQRLLKLALKEENEKFMFFTYSGKVGFTGKLSMELMYRKDPEVSIVAKEEKDSNIISMSLRSRTKDVSKLLKQALVGLEGGGGGHEHACGAHIKKEDFEKFINTFRELVS